MNLLKIENYYVTYQKQGNDKNGNPIYLINFFDENMENLYYKLAEKKFRLDKHNNLKITSYNILSNIKLILNAIGGNVLHIL
jgi:hypothetical protein